MAGFILVVAAGGLTLYGFWSSLTGTDDEEERDVGEELEEAKAAVEGIVLQSVEFPLRAEATGHLAPWRRADISVQAGGIILARPVEEGQQVRKGDLLLQLDDRPQQIQLRESKAALLAAKVEYAEKVSGSRSLAEGDTTELAAARVQLQRAVADFDQGMLTQAELQQARREFDIMNVLSGSQRDEVHAVTTNLAQSEQQVESAELELSRTRLIAPFSGRVANLLVEAGQNVGAGTQVLTLLEDDRMKVSVDVLEADLVHIVVGVSANVVVPNFSDEVFLGRVFSINPEITMDGGFGRVTVALSNPEGRLISGMHANVALETERLQDRLVVPVAAVLPRQGRELVFKTVQGRSYWTYVNVGARSGNFAEIIGAGGTNIVEHGDTILVAGHDALPHDVPVEVTRVRELDLQ